MIRYTCRYTLNEVKYIQCDFYLTGRRGEKEKGDDDIYIIFIALGLVIKYREGGYKTEGGDVRFYPYKKRVGAEQVIAMLKGEGCMESFVINFMP